MTNEIENKTPRQILEKFYIDNHLPLDGGQTSPFAKIQLNKYFAIYFPNFKSRRKALIKHDIHHLVTGYPASSLIGESEISAWEIAAGCKKYWAAFVIDTSGLLIGVPFHFYNILKAFARGRRTKSLYHDILSNDTALDMTVIELQQFLHLDAHDKNSKPGFGDFILFLAFILYGIIFSLLSVVFLPAIILYTIFQTIKNKN